MAKKRKVFGIPKIKIGSRSAKIKVPIKKTVSMKIKKPKIKIPSSPIGPAAPLVRFFKKLKNNTPKNMQRLRNSRRSSIRSKNRK